MTLGRNWRPVLQEIADEWAAEPTTKKGGGMGPTMDGDPIKQGRDIFIHHTHERNIAIEGQDQPLQDSSPYENWANEPGITE